MGNSIGLSSMVSGVMSIGFNILMMVLLGDLLIVSVIRWMMVILAIFIGLVGLLVDDSRRLAGVGIFLGVCGWLFGIFIGTMFDGIACCL
ncbi:MAG: hypothetical protein ACFFE4_19790 [Candidatus Thorarchaeota archaeon]